MMLTRLRELEPISLRVAILSLCIALILLAMRILWIRYPYHGNPMPFILTALYLATAYGLIHMFRWARRIIVVILWVLIVVMPIGFFSPFYASDLRAEGIDPPSVEYLLAFIIPSVVWAVWCIHVLGKHKVRFS